MHINKIIIFTSLLFAYIFCFNISSFGAEIYHQNSAASRAQEVFAAVGWESQSPSKAELIISRHTQKKIWQVTSDDYVVALDSATGIPHFAMKRKAMPKRRADIVSISEQIANTKASEYLQSVGLLLHDARLFTSEPLSHFSQPGGMRWEVNYKRFYKGFPFKFDYIRVALDPSNAELLSFGYNFHSPLPDSTQVILNQLEAVDIAVEYFDLLGIQEGQITYAELMIVQPNNFWEVYDGADLIALPIISRLAWIFRFDTPWFSTEIWVDSESGDILGGGMSLSASKIEVNSPAIDLADEIFINSVESPEKTAFSKGSNDYNSILSSIRSLSRVKMTESISAPLKLLFSGKDRSYTLAYSSTDHLLVLLEKSYKGKTMKGNMAWKTNEEFEKLMAGYLDQ